MTKEDFLKLLYSGDANQIDKEIRNDAYLYKNFYNKFEYNGAIGTNLFPIHIVSALGYLDCVKCFITAKGKDLALSNSEANYTPIHYAAANNRIDVVKYLALELHVDIDAINKTGITPLHLATERGHVEVVRFLQSQGAKVDIKNTKNNKTVLDIANDSTNNEIRKLYGLKEITLPPPQSQNTIITSPLQSISTNTTIQVTGTIITRGDVLGIADITGTVTVTGTNAGNLTGVISGSGDIKGDIKDDVTSNVASNLPIIPQLEDARTKSIRIRKITTRTRIEKLLILFMIFFYGGNYLSIIFIRGGISSDSFNYIIFGLPLGLLFGYLTFLASRFAIPFASMYLQDAIPKSKVASWEMRVKLTASLIFLVTSLFGFMPHINLYIDMDPFIYNIIASVFSVSIVELALLSFKLLTQLKIE